MAGYSGRGLVDKLGIKPGAVALAIQSPPGYGNILGTLPAGASLREATARQAASKSLAKSAPFPFIQCFCRETPELEALFPTLKSMMPKDGALWISWPKRTAFPKGTQLPPDALDENIVRRLGLAAGLVDVKVCAVDETWSGLKFMFRVSDR